ncbi:LpqB family beta-propeller domain-containing protein [Streptomyces sp. NPDC002004]
MGGERWSRRRRTIRTGVALGCGAALLAGCASMPDSGDLRGVEASQRPDSQVRVFAMPPRDNASPFEIMQGFLEALTSDDPQFDMARKYLTKDASKNWHPDRSTTILADGPNTSADRVGNGTEGGRTYTLSGRRVARVDGQQAYEPAGGTFGETVHLTQEDGPDGRQWRIDAPPAGAVLGQSDFERMYQPVNKYYFALGSPSRESGPEGLVADPVFVRQRGVDPLTQTVRSLLDGPTHWLNPVVRSSFPTGTRLKDGVKELAPDDENKLKVPLNARADRVGQKQCLEMAAQLLFTLQDLASTAVDQVELQGSNGSQLCVLGADRAETIAPHRTAGRADYQYFLDAKSRLVRLPGNGGGGSPEPVPGPFGKDDRAWRAVAVSRDEDRAAGVSMDGRQLYVGALVSGASLGDPVVRSHAKEEKDALTAPSWDGRGDLWVADRDPKSPRLLMLEQGGGTPLEVKTPGLDASRIEAVRVAADGVRIALLVEENGKRTLRIGRVERQGDAGRPSDVAVVETRPAAPQMEDVTAMSWAGSSRLVVVGRESGGVLQMRYIQCDGSAPTAGLLPGLTGVKAITASDDDRLPLVAQSDDGIVRLPPGAAWQTVLKDGTAPVYPG